MAMILGNFKDQGHIRVLGKSRILFLAAIRYLMLNAGNIVLFEEFHICFLTEVMQLSSVPLSVRKEVRLLF